MRRLAHLSDLHFGTDDPQLVVALAADVRDFAPHLTVVTGDLTQRAKVQQFQQAQAFLESLASRSLVVPGNHDIAPLYRPILRLFDPYRHFRRFFGEKLETTYIDRDMMVVGLSSVKPLRWKEGRISRRQVDWIASQTAGCGVPFRILALHHPVLRIEADGGLRGRRGPPLLHALDEIGIDLLLMGHLHQGHSGIAVSTVSPSDSLLVVQASTATSSRLRGHLNGYNRIRLEAPGLSIERRVWDGRRFSSEGIDEFERLPLNWRRVAPGRFLHLASA